MKQRNRHHTASIMGIERLRDNVDGPGIRTLVLFDSCPLNCEYCINKMMLKSGIKKDFSVEELYDLLRIDDPYYEISDGGVTFGGGEPALQSQFIENFYNLTEGRMSIILETSLSIPLEHVQKLAPIVDRFYVDVKDMNPEIYSDYTHEYNHFLLTNLEWLAKNGYASKVIARVPLIPEFNTEEDQAKSVKELKEMGFEVETFKYVQTHKPLEPIMLMGVPELPDYPDDLMGDLKPEEDIIHTGDEREEEM